MVAFHGVVSLDPRHALLERARQAASAAERHHCAYYAVEATLRLSVAARHARHLEQGGDPATLQRFHASLPRASVGTWLGALRTLTKASGERLPRPDRETVGALAQACLEERVISAEVRRQALAGLPPAGPAADLGGPGAR